MIVAEEIINYLNSKNIEQASFEEISKYIGSKLDLKPEATDEAVKEALFAPEVLDEFVVVPESYNLIRRSYLFEETEFYIELTPEEVKDKILYIGHRFIPFIRPFFMASDLKILFNGKELKHTRKSLHIEDAFKFFSMIGAHEGVLTLDRKNEEHAFMEAIDLSEMELSEGDFIKVKVKDLDKFTYEFEIVSHADFYKNSMIYEKRKRQIIDTIMDLFRGDDPRFAFLDAQTMLAVVFAKLYEQGNVQTVKEPGYPMKVYVDTEEFMLDIYTQYPAFKPKNLDILAHHMKNLEMPKFIEIVREYGIMTMPPALFKSLIIMSYHEEGEVDDELVLQNIGEILDEIEPEDREQILVSYTEYKQKVLDEYEQNKPSDEFVEVLSLVTQSAVKAFRLGELADFLSQADEEGKSMDEITSVTSQIMAVSHEMINDGFDNPDLFKQHKEAYEKAMEQFMATLQVIEESLMAKLGQFGDEEM